MDFPLPGLCPTRVALVHDWLNGMRGGEKVLEGLSELFPGAPIFTLFCEPHKISPRLRAHPIHTSFIARVPGWRRYYRYYLPLFPSAVQRFDLSNFDLIVSTSHCVAKSAPKPKQALHVCYCHSPMRYVWDLYEQYLGDCPRLHPRRLAMSLLRSPLQRWDRRTAARADFFVANSRYIAEKIARFYGRESTVIYPPVDVDLFQPPPKGQTREDFFLVASALVPYKRIDLAVKAFEGRPERLLIAGDGPEAPRLQAMAPPNVRFLGWQSADQLKLLYQRCRALLFPGIEDFGIVPVEAMASGAPVVAFAKGGLTETVIDGCTGVLYEEQSVDGLRSALDRLDRLTFDSAVLRCHAERFSRPRFLREMLTFISQKWAEFRGKN